MKTILSHLINFKMNRMLVYQILLNLIIIYSSYFQAI